MDVCRVGGRERFSPEEEEAVRKDESTSAVAKRAHREAKVGGDAPEVRGDDKSRGEVKAEQKGFHAAPFAAHVGHAAFEGSHMLEVHAVEHFVLFGGGAVGAAASLGGGALAGLLLGAWELEEAHENGVAQREALAKDQIHVAILGALDLPAGYKQARLDFYRDVPRGHGSAAFRITEALAKAPKAIAVLQLHADRGMHAALECRAAGLGKADLLRANPKLAAQYAEDPAFKEGFDAALSVTDAEVPKLKADLEARDARYACAGASVRG